MHKSPKTKSKAMPIVHPWSKIPRLAAAAVAALLTASAHPTDNRRFDISPTSDKTPGSGVDRNKANASVSARNSCTNGSQRRMVGSDRTAVLLQGVSTPGSEEHVGRARSGVKKRRAGRSSIGGEEGGVGIEKRSPAQVCEGLVFEFLKAVVVCGCLLNHLIITTSRLASTHN